MFYYYPVPWGYLHLPCLCMETFVCWHTTAHLTPRSHAVAWGWAPGTEWRVTLPRRWALLWDTLVHCDGHPGLTWWQGRVTWIPFQWERYLQPLHYEKSKALSKCYFSIQNLISDSEKKSPTSLTKEGNSNTYSHCFTSTSLGLCYRNENINQSMCCNYTHLWMANHSFDNGSGVLKKMNKNTVWESVFLCTMYECCVLNTSINIVI